jgi:ferritin-like metal-binding protein YciE
VVINVALFFDLADHRAAALGASNQAREGKIVLAALGTLAEEKKTDETLTRLAEQEVNQHAQAA